MFAKIFTQILDSSLAEDWQARVVFEDLLKLCDQNGVVDRTAEAIARRTNVPMDIVKRGIAELEKPDPKSRNPVHEGRRIVRLDEHRDWGWLIVNYEYYRNLASEEQRREKTRLRVQKFRVTHGNACNAPVTPVNACNAKQREKQMDIIENRQSGALAPVRAKFQIPSLEEIKTQAADIALPVSEAESFFNYYQSNGWRVGKNPMKSWQHAFANWHKKWNEGGSQPRRGTDRNKGALNEGSSSDYAQV